MLAYLHKDKKPKKNFIVLAKQNHIIDFKLYHKLKFDHKPSNSKPQHPQNKNYSHSLQYPIKPINRNIIKPENSKELESKSKQKKKISKVLVRVDCFNKLILKDNKILPLPKENSPSNKPKYIYKEHYYQEDKNSSVRKKMEDFHKIVPLFIQKEQCSFFGIFDGHGGDTVSIYCKDYFDTCVKKCLQATNFDIDKSLPFAFKQVDNNINSTIDKNDCGSTATIVLIYKDKETKKRKISCANVGDSKCYLLKRSMKCIMLSTDHTCKNSKEVERIKKTGASVFNGRIFGTLIVTRTIGDKEMKNYGVISTPSVCTVEVDEEDDNYVIIASDGVWDIVNEEKIQVFCEQEMTAEALCKRLVKIAIEDGTNDNVSCIVVKL